VSVVSGSVVSAAGSAQNPSLAVNRGGSSAFAFLFTSHDEPVTANYTAGANTTELYGVGDYGGWQGGFMGISAAGTGSVTLNHNTSTSPGQYAAIGFALLEDSEEANDIWPAGYEPVSFGAQSASDFDISVTVPTNCAGVLVFVIAEDNATEAETGCTMAGLSFTEEVEMTTTRHSRIYALYDVEGNTGAQTVSLARNNTDGIWVGVLFLKSSGGGSEKVATATLSVTSADPVLTLDPGGDRTLILLVGWNAQWYNENCWPEYGTYDDTSSAELYYRRDADGSSEMAHLFGPVTAETTHSFNYNTSTATRFCAIGVKSAAAAGASTPHQVIIIQ
jgi:hypothetical protein